MTQPENQKRVSTKVALGETFRLALDTLRVHKMRSFLTLLGIILAVATLVGVMSIVVVTRTGSRSGRFDINQLLALSH